MADSNQTILEKLSSGLFWCRSCGEAHRGMFDLACIAPTGWPDSRTYRPIDEGEPESRHGFTSWSRPKRRK